MSNETKSRPFSRREWLTRAGAFAAAIGAPIPFGKYLPIGVTPLALAASGPAFGKKGLTLLSERPLSAETPAHLLDDAVTPASKLFVRNNGLTPSVSKTDVADWRLIIDGFTEQRLELSIADLKSKFEMVTLQLMLECGGNGRKYFSPPAKGNQWTFGAVGCPEWTGVRLRDVLTAAGVKPAAIYTAHYGADPHLSGDPEKTPISRGVPIAKAMEPHSLIAVAMNGAPMPVENGHPLRLVIPGWPGSCSHKWLTRIELRDRVHDGEKMTGHSYRIPKHPVPHGVDVPESEMQIIEAMPVKSLITSPQTGVRRTAKEPFEIRGAAWVGEGDIERMDISIDFGATWRQANLNAGPNPYSWRRWRAEVALPDVGYYEIWARATDANGRAQPPIPPGWNPRGYLNNMQHRIAVLATGRD